MPKKSIIFLIFIFITIELWAGSDVVQRYGQLKINGNALKDSAGNSIQLKGVSSHGLQWFPFVVDKTVKNLVNLMGVEVIRAAMYVKEWDAAKNQYAGYLGSHSWVKGQVIEVVRDAIDEGIYVIVDWHIHWNAQDPNNPHWTDNPFTNDAKAFFNEMANSWYNGKQFKDYPNVIWEVMNEPGHTISWNQVKSHANAVIDEIRNTCNDKDNIILVPATNWAQNLDLIAWDGSNDRPDRRQPNIAYTLHFYASSHGWDIRNKAETALNNGLAIFVTEWGTGDFTGCGYPNYNSSKEWVDWMALKKISWTAWNFSDKNETTALLTPNVGMGGSWSENQLSESGGWIDGWIGGGGSSDFDPNSHYKLEVVHSGKTLTVENWSTSNGGNIVQNSFYNGNNQLWKIVSVGGGFYKIVNVHSNYVLDVAGYSNDNGGNIHQWNYNGTNNQQWQIFDIGNGEYKIISRQSSKCLDVAGYSTNDNGNVHQWTYLGNPNQKWRIIKN